MRRKLTSYTLLTPACHCALGILGGLKDGKGHANLTRAKRVEIAKKAALARWSK
jgi:hypothetical protein